MSRAALVTAALGATLLAVAACGGGQADARHSTGQRLDVTATTPKPLTPWAEVISVAGPAGTSAGLPCLRLRPDGSALVIDERLTGEYRVPSATRFIQLTPGGAAAKVAEVTGKGVFSVGSARADGRVDVVLVRAADTREISRPELRTIEPGGQVGPAQEIPVTWGRRQGGLTAVDVSVAPDGAALMAWAETRDSPDPGDYGESYDTTLKIATRAPGASRFGAPRTVRRTTGLPGDLTTAIAPGGRIALAATGVDYRATRHELRVWTGTVGRGLDAGRDVGPQSSTTAVKLAITPRGRTVIAWGNYAHGEDPHSGWEIRTASIAPGARRATAVQLLDPAKLIVSGTPQTLALAAGPGERVTLAWSHRRNTREPVHEVRVATASGAGRFKVMQKLPYANVGGLAVDDRGNAVLTVGGSPDWKLGTTYALVRGSGAQGFGAGEPLATPLAATGWDELNGLAVPVPAIDPLTGRPAIAWTEAGGSGGSRVVLQRRDRP